jgi:cellulose synthase/poly-beta-1,6-N-acetylglucosamine synthase-like glycosyltransferase
MDRRIELGDKKSTTWITANTPMYDEDPESIRFLFESYDAIYKKCGFIETTFLVDKISETMETMLGLLTSGSNMVRKSHLAFFPNHPDIQIRLLNDRRILYTGSWPNLPHRKWTLVYKCFGGGKRSSQLVYATLLQFLVIQRPRDAVLFVDADTEFNYDNMMKLYNGLMKKPKCGVVCGDVRIRNNVNALTFAQIYEYMTSHALTKTAESHFGIVLCAPGAWCMYRIEALEDTLRKFSLHPTNIREYHRLEQGEDRYLTTLSLDHGWKARMIKSSIAYTKCPETMRRLMEQRRRWNNSTLENNFTALFLGFLWRNAFFYMISLAIDVMCYLIYPSIFITLFGNSMAIAVPLVTGWDPDWVRYGSYGIILVCMVIQIFVFLLPIESKKLVWFFRIFVFIYSVVIVAIAVFVILPFVLPKRLRRAPVRLPGFTLGIGGDTSAMEPLFTKRDANASWLEEFARETLALLNLGLLRLLLGAALLFYAAVMVSSSYRLRGRKSLWIALIGGPIFAFLSPTFYFTFLWFSITRFDSTSWR